MVIDYFRGSRTKISVAFFYFDYQDEDRQSPALVLSSILRQLVATLSEIPQSISDAYEKHQKSGTSCSLEELEQLMKDVLKIVDQSVIIIDALDECDKSRHRKPFLQILRRLQQIQNLRVFVTSRQNFQDIMVAFNSHPQIAITAHNFDLQCYMRQEMELAGLDEIVDASFANTIIKAVIAKAQGM
jgi:archaellum biogenesis ATPase FlaH